MRLDDNACEQWLFNTDEGARVIELHSVRAAWKACEALMQQRIAELTRERDEARAEKDNAYKERDSLVCALSKLFPSSLERHPDEDASWENDWRWIVFIELPAGQATWHIHDSELAQFEHLPRLEGRKWDGHTTPQKYDRLSALKSSAIAEAAVAGAYRIAADIQFDEPTGCSTSIWSGLSEAAKHAILALTPPAAIRAEKRLVAQAKVRRG